MIPYTMKRVTGTISLGWLILGGLYLLRPIIDPDFFWHLATGRWISENLRLPAEDPFSYTTPGHLTSRETFILRSYWLSQVIYWFMYKTLGFNGIVLLRFVLFFLMAYFLNKRTALEVKDRVLLPGLLLVFTVSILSVYPMDRPQVWSFVFFSVFLYLLSSERYPYIMPGLMLLWSNMHGGYILGEVLIITSLGGRFIEGLLLKKRGVIKKDLLIGGLLAIPAGLINPCTYHAIRETLRMPTSMRQGIIEYQTTISAFLKMGDLSLVIYWGLLLLASLGIIKNLTNKEKIDLPELILLLGIGYFSFTQIRFVAFFLIWSLPIVGRTILWSRPWLRYCLTGILVTSSLFLTITMKEYRNVLNLKNIQGQSWISGYYPEAAFRFIKTNGIKGNLYNYYDWGGYLIWRFYPEKAVFIDGRQLYEYLYMQAMSIDKAVKEPVIMGMPFWEATLISYNVNYILVPVFSVPGDLLSLVSQLIDDPYWVPVFFRGNSVVFVRNTKENYPVIYKYSIPRDFLIDDLIGQTEAMLRNSPMNHSLYIALGDLEVKAKRYERALKRYREGLDVSPINQTLKERIRDVEILLRHGRDMRSKPDSGE